MSTESNLNELYNNSIKILTDLISFKTVSGEDNSGLINYCEEYLHKLGATSFKTFDDDKKRVNLFATLKTKNLNNKKPIILSGHTDVVPVSKGWSTDPFTATIKGCLLYTSDAADDSLRVDLGGRRIIKKFFFKQKTAYEIGVRLVGSEMCIRDRNRILLLFVV